MDLMFGLRAAGILLWFISSLVIAAHAIMCLGKVKMNPDCTDIEALLDCFWGTIPKYNIHKTV